MAQGVQIALDQQAQSLRRRVDDALAEAVNFGPGCPEQLREAIRHSLLAPGKRLRPLLVLWAAEACGGTHEAAMPGACAVEMVHAYSLIHDDLPAMDDDDLRRGRPTCHKVYGEGVAILAGDALLARAFEMLASLQPPEVAARCTAVVAQAAGATELVGGQADDLAGDFEGATVATLESIHRRKTGAMFLACLRVGALIARADAARLAALEAYGRAIGLAFQITDDLLDVRGDTAELGKRAGKDSDRGKITFPGLLGIEESQRRAAALVEEACAAVQPLGSSASSLEVLARYVLERTH